MQLDEDLAERLLLSCSALTRGAAAVADGTRLSLTQARVLGTLHRDGPLRVSRLADLEGCAQPSMTGLVSRLADAGLVTRTTDPADARAVLVALTDEGRTALLANRRALRAPLARALHDLPVTPGDLERLTGLLEEITTELVSGRTLRVG
ncbi:MarR family transcriptional regulator [Kineococcus sp. NPDC059986]|jgi:DNA-binding MarR family transcriptional regulator|uniref:MarR family winged helix-turn-helix transcriptional regulator n=1 Tax=Kineococcus sp. NPDC059986 TaxID=3155538 RepID=UPI003450E23F